MANNLPRNFSPSDEGYPPSVFERHLAAGLASSVPLNSASRVARHLPCMLICEATAGQILQVTDVLGNVSNITFPATGTFQLRISPAAIGGASTTLTAVTVCYQTDPG